LSRHGLTKFLLYRYYWSTERDVPVSDSDIMVVARPGLVRSVSLRQIRWLLTLFVRRLTVPENGWHTEQIWREGRVKNLE
jgi:hypothetical protein